MGSWGASIFSDDTAADVRDEFTDLIGEGLTPRDATRRLIQSHADTLSDREDDAVAFWLGLATTQWKLGRLLPMVRKRALAIITSGADLRRWEGLPPGFLKERGKHLAGLREKLLGPMPAPRKVPRRRKCETDFRPGDIVLYRLTSRTSVRFAVINLWGDLGGVYANICLLGIYDGKPFRARKLRPADTLGPHYTMLGREPKDLVTVERRGVARPRMTTKLARAWNHLPVDGHACPWNRFPESLRKVIRKLGWTSRHA